MFSQLQPHFSFSFPSESAFQALFDPPPRKGIVVALRVLDQGRQLESCVAVFPRRSAPARLCVDVDCIQIDRDDRLLDPRGVPIDSRRLSAASGDGDDTVADGSAGGGGTTGAAAAAAATSSSSSAPVKAGAGAAPALPRSSSHADAAEAASAVTVSFSPDRLVVWPDPSIPRHSSLRVVVADRDVPYVRVSYSGTYHVMLPGCSPGALFTARLVHRLAAGSRLLMETPVMMVGARMGRVAEFGPVTSEPSFESLAAASAAPAPAATRTTDAVSVATATVAAARAAAALGPNVSAPNSILAAALVMLLRNAMDRSNSNVDQSNTASSSVGSGGGSLSKKRQRLPDVVEEQDADDDDEGGGGVVRAHGGNKKLKAPASTFPLIPTPVRAPTPAPVQSPATAPTASADESHAQSSANSGQVTGSSRRQQGLGHVEGFSAFEHPEQP